MFVAARNGARRRRAASKKRPGPLSDDAITKRAFGRRWEASCARLCVVRVLVRACSESHGCGSIPSHYLAPCSAQLHRVLYSLLQAFVGSSWNWIPPLLLFSRLSSVFYNMERKLTQMSQMEKLGLMPRAFCPSRPLFLCSEPCTNMHPCFSFSVLNLRDQVSDLSEFRLCVGGCLPSPVLFVGSTVRFWFDDVLTFRLSATFPLPCVSRSKDAKRSDDGWAWSRKAPLRSQPVQVHVLYSVRGTWVVLFSAVFRSAASLCALGAVLRRSTLHFAVASHCFACSMLQDWHCAVYFALADVIWVFTSQFCCSHVVALMHIWTCYCILFPLSSCVSGTDWGASSQQGRPIPPPSPANQHQPRPEMLRSFKITLIYGA